ncbi:MAG: hypothetical protein HC918_10805 [Oscillatoriales cyanobacterium SM2_1_8]|nr:hypothetical protein [Oscillatoriales cyanobacterium SM2_1_8]
MRPVGCWLAIGWMFIWVPSVAADEPLCYLETPDRPRLDLSALCGQTVPFLPALSPPTEFARDLATAIAGYPEERTPLAAIPLPAYQEAARNICQALRDGTFTELRNQLLGDVRNRETSPETFREGARSPDRDRVVETLSFQVAKDLGAKHYCPEFLD